MKRFKVLLGALVCMCMAFLITPVAQAADAPQNGWIQEEDGYYYYENGMMVTYQLIEDPNGYTYYVGEDGRMVTDTLEWVDGGNRYFNESGAMVTSTWKQITTYYEDDYEEWSWTEWYYFGSDGIAYTGVQTVNGVEYFFYGGGTLADYATVTYDETHIVKVNDAGVVIDKAEIQYNNWTYMGGEWYWFDDVYEPAQGIREIYGYTYCFDDGQMIKDDIIDTDMGKRAFGPNGYMVENAWYLFMEDYEKCWCYFGANGVPGEGWFAYAGAWYYLKDGKTKIGDYIMDYYGEDHLYSFDTDGKMLKDIVLKTGWFAVDSAWYYYNGERLLQDEWATLGGYTYYFYGDGIMATSDVIYDETGDKGYVVNESGHWVKNQWVEIKMGTFFQGWAYADAKGVAVTDSWKVINGAWYYFQGVLMVDYNVIIDEKLELFNASGVWLGTSSVTTGWVSADDSWYYLENGEFVTGWKAIDDFWYYFDASSYLAYSDGFYWINGKAYLFNTNASLANGWVLTSWGDWYLSDSAGVMLTGWQNVSGTWYYLDYSMCQNGIYWTGDTRDLFDASGAWCGSVNSMSDGWHQLAGQWYYFEDGDLVDGWVKSSGELYYCNDYEMLANDSLSIDCWSNGQLGTKSYFCGFDANGTLLRNQWFYFEELEEWVWCDKEGIFVSDFGQHFF